MAGHSKFKNIMHRKGAQDARRARTFNKIAREITVASKQGMPDPVSNPRLRAAIIKARSVNMTNDRIDRAIKAGGMSDGANYEEVRYEGYGPGGVAVIIEALTDNRNRTAAEIRMVFSKNGGTMGESNSVAFMFQRIGEIRYPLNDAKGKPISADAMFEAVVEAGGENLESDDESHIITTGTEDVATVRDALEPVFGTPASAKLGWKPTIETPPTDIDAARSLFNFIELLEENDDVQEVITNADIPAEWMEQLAG